MDLNDINETMNRRFNQVDTRFNQVDAKVDKLFDLHETQQDKCRDIHNDLDRRLSCVIQDMAMTKQKQDDYDSNETHNNSKNMGYFGIALSVATLLVLAIDFIFKMHIGKG